MEHVRLSKRQYLTADRSKVVDESDEAAAFFYGGPGQLVSKQEADQLGASYSGSTVSGDEALDTLHVEVETPNLIPGSARVEGSGKATIPVTQADRAVASGLSREEVSGTSAKHQRREGEALLSGDLKPLPDQKVVGQQGSRTKQTAQMRPDHYTEGEKQTVVEAENQKTKESKQKTEAAQKQATQEAQQKQQQAPGNKMADRPADK